MAATVITIRHGETDWSITRRHTGRTDIPLTDTGRERARSLAPLLAAFPGIDDALVLTSPLSRAVETCALAGLGARATTWDELLEWDYGAAEGRTTEEIRGEVPGWSVWTHPIDGGEQLADVGARVDRVVARLDTIDGLVVLVAHAHVLRILGARWCGWPPEAGRSLVLGAASLSVLGHERESRVIEQWNVGPPVHSETVLRGRSGGAP
jgi:probable phosphoglycerate mutase